MVDLEVQENRGIDMARPKKLVIENVEQNTTDVVITEVKTLDNFELSAEIVAGSLTSNAMELKALVENELQNYTTEKFVGNPDGAAKEKAKLNKLTDAIAAKRKDVTKAWNKPLDDFLETMKGLEKTVSEASNKLRTIVVEADNKEKEEKKHKIEEYFSTLDFKIVPLERIFNPKWLNKTMDMTKIMLEIEAITEKISGEMATLRSMKDEDSETLMSFYMDTLDLNATLQKGNQLKENRAKIQAENERQAEAWRKQKLAEAEKPAVSTVAVNPEPKTEVPLMTFTLKLFGTKDQLVALRQYIDEHGIKYEKLG